jgi:hypothetical protein
MVRHASAIGLACGVLFAASAAFAQAPAGKPDGLALGIRTGYALPIGTIGATPGTSSQDLTAAVRGVLPIWLDAGYRVSPNFYLGGFFQYGFGIASKDGPCSVISCSAHDLQFGANVHYHIQPAGSFDPWVGVGVGYEILQFSESVLRGEGGTDDFSRSFKGFEFITLQAGGDFKATPDFAVGPFANFSLGQFSSYSASLAGSPSPSGDLAETGIHEWLTIGVRGQYNL